MYQQQLEQERNFIAQLQPPVVQKPVINPDVLAPQGQLRVEIEYNIFYSEDDKIVSFDTNVPQTNNVQTLYEECVDAARAHAQSYHTDANFGRVRRINIFKGFSTIGNMIWNGVKIQNNSGGAFYNP